MKYMSFVLVLAIILFCQTGCDRDNSQLDTVSEGDFELIIKGEKNYRYDEAKITDKVAIETTFSYTGTEKLEIQYSEPLIAILIFDEDNNPLMGEVKLEEPNIIEIDSDFSFSHFSPFSYKDFQHFSAKQGYYATAIIEFREVKSGKEFRIETSIPFELIK